MGFGVHSAVVLVDKVAGAMTFAAPDAGATGDKASEKGGDSHAGCRETSRAWGDARLLTSVRLATE